jgi:hypothetical protein
MNEHLIGYLLNTLDDDTHHLVAVYLRDHPEGRQRLEELRQTLALLSEDRAAPTPPADLAKRTLAHIEKQGPRDLPRAPALSRSFSGDRSLWRRTDLLVAASMLLLVGGIAALATFKARQTQALVGCQNNLREFHGALEDFRHQQRHYPDVVSHKQRGVAGMVMPVLIQTGFLDPQTSVRCPAIGDPQPCPLTLEQLQALSDEEFFRHAPHLAGCYAYALGFRDGDGHYFCPGEPLAAGMPLMADCPGPDVQAGNSLNHGGGGQNVLFQDGHVMFLSTRGINGDDFYLNKHRQVAAGVDQQDSVLGASASKP